MIKEYFVTFLKMTDSIGRAMTVTVLEQLKELGILLSDLRGQGYDNGANMKTKHRL